MSGICEHLVNLLKIKEKYSSLDSDAISNLLENDYCLKMDLIKDSLEDGIYREDVLNCISYPKEGSLVEFLKYHEVLSKLD